MAGRVLVWIRGTKKKSVKQQTHYILKRFRMMRSNSVPKLFIDQYGMLVYYPGFNIGLTFNMKDI